ncbi:CRISPR-associated endonuclease Cas2 [Saprospira sp. CCB-QB6]|uniref:CRISPR-associated endonuclease Cas2 n=1 Tax=Saprospira sp. CCB-QB6 TaxID=3023936 RepID=UPI00234BA3C1|nr:CRISPR-associated endonuclease Cas2 [Saprospira sp. CCB-QB6]WCL80820.1 CRISPR-associated endonuclease Cas2 [Saprospira sp. CCB-QB6]
MWFVLGRLGYMLKGGRWSIIRLKQLLAEAKEIMDEDYDSLIIFKSRSDRWVEKEVIGREQNDLDCFL